MKPDTLVGASSTAVPGDGIRISGLDGSSAPIGVYDTGLHEAFALRYMPGTDVLPIGTTDRAVATRQLLLAGSASTASEHETIPAIMTREELVRDLWMLERKFGMTSEVFYALWQTGQAPIHGIDALRWAALWEAWRERYLI
jgi:hypothetical protein